MGESPPDGVEVRPRPVWSRGAGGLGHAEARREVRGSDLPRHRDRIEGYGPRDSLRIIDAKRLKETGKLNIITTRDYHIMENYFPARELGFNSNFSISYSKGEGGETKCRVLEWFSKDLLGVIN